MGGGIMMKDRIIELKNTAETRIKDENSRYSMISFLRLISFLSAVVLFFLGFSKTNLIFILGGVAAFIIFIVFVKLHSEISKRINHHHLRILNNH